LVGVWVKIVHDLLLSMVSILYQNRETAMELQIVRLLLVDQVLFPVNLLVYWA